MSYLIIAIVAILIIAVVIALIFGGHFNLKDKLALKKDPANVYETTDSSGITSKPFSRKADKLATRTISSIELKERFTNTDYHVINTESISTLRIEDIAFIENERKFRTNSGDDWISYNELKNMVYESVIQSAPSHMVIDRGMRDIHTSFGKRKCRSLSLKKDPAESAESKVYFVGETNNLIYMSHSFSDIPLDFPFAVCELTKSSLIKESESDFRIKDSEDILIGDDLTKITREEIRFEIAPLSRSSENPASDIYNVKIQHTDENITVTQRELLDLLWLNHDISDEDSVFEIPDTSTVKTPLGKLECKKYSVHGDDFSKNYDAYVFDDILVKIQIDENNSMYWKDTSLIVAK